MHLNSASDLLRSQPLFKDLPYRQIEIAADLFNFGPVAAGEMIMRSSSQSSFIYFVLNGYTKITTPRDDDTDLVLGFRGAGEILGEMSVMDATDKSATVLAHTDCEMAWINPENFWGVLWEFSSIPLNMAHLLNQRIRRLNAAMNALVPTQSETRLARQLLLLAKDFGNESAHDETVTFPFSLSLTDLVGLTASPRSEINDLLREWRKDGLIGAFSNTETPFTVRDVAALQELSAAHGLPAYLSSFLSYS